MKKQRGKFITVEGIEGVGKTTLINQISIKLKNDHQDFLITKEPGGTKLGLQIRNLLFDSKQNIEPISELLLMFVDRNQHYKEVINPCLNQGKIVISDRFVDSTYAYQGAGRGIDLRLIAQLEEICYGNFKPDLVLWLDLDEKLAFERVGKRGEATNRFEKEKLEFFTQARALFEKRCNQFDHIKRIDASLTIEQINSIAIKLIENI